MDDTLGASRSWTATPVASTRGAAHTRAPYTPRPRVSWALLASGVNCVVAWVVAMRARSAASRAPALACLALALARDFASWAAVLENTINLPE